ncbi:hypothetical protein SDC9_204989 [bioreactor metagenome]|uniref:Uncharacterized protein n=1 Tax=bioreactor metagenome TaxID=1076179 RepID=A0A645J0S6_9ZZZZ
MVLRDVEHFEVVEVVLHLGPLCDFISHADENFLKLIEDNIERMPAADGKLCAGGRYVKPFGLHTHFGGKGGEGGLAALDERLNFTSDGVGNLSDVAALFRGQSPHFFHNSGKLALFSEEFNSRLLNFGESRRLLHCFGGALPDFLQRIFHDLSPHK